MSFPFRMWTKVVAFLVTVGSAVPTVFAGEPGLQDRDDIYMQTSFESDDWRQDWTGVRKDENIRVVSGEDAFQGNRHLRISVDEGDHYGGSLKYYFEDEVGSEPEAVYFRYALRFGPTWIAYRNGKLPGFGGTYGKAGWGGRPSNGDDGWSARMRFTEPTSGRKMGNTAISYYVYHADMDGKYGDHFRHFAGPPIGDDGGLPRGQWHQIEGYVEMNTPNGDASTEGARDGVLRAWVDGQKVFEKTDLRFRDTSDLKAEFIWVDHYYGGNWTAPRDLFIELDNIVIAENYIGPYEESPPRERVGPQFSGVPHFGSRDNYTFKTPDRWWVVEEDGDARLFLRTSDHEPPGQNMLGAWALADDRTYRGFEMTGTVKTAESLSTNDLADWAIVFGWEDPDNYLFVLGNGRMEYSSIIRVEDGEASRIAVADEALVPDEQWHDIRVRYAARTGRLEVGLDGTTVLTTHLDEPTEGRVGVGSLNDSAFFDDIAFQSVDERDPGADGADIAERVDGGDTGTSTPDTGSSPAEDTAGGPEDTAAPESDASDGGDTRIEGRGAGCSCRTSGRRPALPMAWLLVIVGALRCRRDPD